jgi:Ca2+-binding RTX toxin-like protein
MTNLISSSCVYNPEADQFDILLTSGIDEGGTGANGSSFIEEVSFSIINATAAIVEDGVKKAGGSIAAQNTLSSMVLVAGITAEVLADLYNERQTNGEQSMQNKIVTIAQTSGGIIAASIVAAPVIAGASAIGAGIMTTLAVGVGVGYLTEAAYNAKIFDDGTSSASDKLAEFVNAFNYNQFKDDLYLVASEGPEFLIESAQERLSSLLTDTQTIGNYLSNLLFSLTQSEAISTPGVVDPLALDLNHNGQIDLIALNNSNAFFDLDNDGLREQVGWVGSGDGFLVLDENNNGSVDNIEELFGGVDEFGNTVEGTQELRNYDLNNDNVIDNQDAIFSELKIWQDLNQDGITDEGELTSLADHNITSINLNTTQSNLNQDGNVILSNGDYTYLDDEQTNQTGLLSNLELAINQTNSGSYVYQDNLGNTIDYTLNLETLILPFSRGYGDTKAWHIAASEDEVLLNLLKNIKNINNPEAQTNQSDLTTFQNLDQKIEQFIYQWTNTTDVTGNRGAFDGKKLAALEAIRGVSFLDSAGNTNVQDRQVNLVQAAWDGLFDMVKDRILVQSVFADIFANSFYDFETDSIDFNGLDQDTIINNIGGYFENNSLSVIEQQYLNYHISGILSNYIQHPEYHNIIGLSTYEEQLFLQIASVSGSSVVKIIDGTSDDDYINMSSNFGSLISGGDGDDTMFNPNVYSDVIIGGKGDDNISGNNAGDDIYIYNIGDGKDTISEYHYSASAPASITQASNGNDKIILGEGIARQDVYFVSGVAGQLEIHFRNNPDDQITILRQFLNINKIEILQFADGTIVDLSNEDDLNFEYYGTNNDETINGTIHNDIIEGKGGDDFLNGKKGDDVYIYNLGDGHDIISEYYNIHNPGGIEDYGNDKIIFGEGILIDDIYFSRIDRDIIIRFRNSTNDSITIPNQIRSLSNRIETLQFADGSTFNIDNAASLTFEYLGTQGNNNVGDRYQASSSNDIINTLGGDDTINAGSGDDIINAGVGDDIINGNQGDDIYIYNNGDGNDTINEKEGNTSAVFGYDKIQFGEGITADDLYFSGDDNKLIIKFKNSATGSITILNQWNSQYQIETAQFADGSTLDLTNRNQFNFIYEGTEGSDIINSSSGDDIINAGAGDDIIDAKGGNDIINAGAGEDLITGRNSGDDTYIYNLGDGKDMIKEYDNSSTIHINSSFGNDKIQFGEGITRDNLYFEANTNDDLVINFRNSPDDKITIFKHLYGALYQIETLQFADGSTLDLTNVNNLNFEYYGTDENDSIYGSDIDDEIQGGKGDDYLSGRLGNDSYFYNIGDGKDRISDSNSYDADRSNTIDKIIFGAGIIATDLIFKLQIAANNKYDLIINFTNYPEDQITIPAQFQSNTNRIETIEFADGGSLDISNVANINVKIFGTDENNILSGIGGHSFEFYAGAGDDRINAGSKDDIINAGGGDDAITNNNGNDTYIYNLGDGKDNIQDHSNIADNNDIIIFGENITREDIYFTRKEIDPNFPQNDSLIINFKNSPNDHIEIKYHFLESEGYNYNIETLQFSDGTTLDLTNAENLNSVPINTAPAITNNQPEVIFTSSQNTNLNHLTQNQSASPIIEDPDGQTVMPETLALNSITASVAVENAKVIFKNSVAGYNSSLGYYLIDNLGNISSPKLLFSGAKSIEQGEEFNLGAIEAGYKVGFFLIANGNNISWQDTENSNNTIKASLTDFSNGEFRFVNHNGGQDANIYTDNNSKPQLIWHSFDDNQDYTIIQNSSGYHGAIYHSTNNPSLNEDNINHSGAGWDINTNNLLIGFEDLKDGGDKDYNDMLFYLDLGDDNEFIQYDNNPGINININDDNNQINQAIIELDQNTIRQGDNLVFENSSKYNINLETGVITLKNGDINTNITINITNNNQTITLTGNNTAQTYEEIINLIKFVHINQEAEDQQPEEENNNNITTNINITITDDNNQSANITQKLEITNQPAQIIEGTQNDDNLIANSNYINIFTGGEGEDSFDFNNLEDSTINKTDIITDFTQGEDKINLSNLNYTHITFDDNPNDEITPEGLSYHFDNDNNSTVIQDSDSDFQIKLSSKIQLSDEDFGFGG